MSLQIYDTMTRRKTAFVPRTAGEVSMYVCGPTVYDVPHLGHGRTALTYDVIRRYLAYSGYAVTHASNITDIDDKIVDRAQREQRSETEVAAEFTVAYDAQLERLGVLPADTRPAATQFIAQMIEVIEGLLAGGAAYEVAGKGVYFSVAAAPGYGELAGRTLEQLGADAGARVDVDADKRSPLDFALWKAARPGEPRWDTPWGPGRPGWHTECVAMSMSALGPGFDIHGGGDDLRFPHHQNEWAQVTAAGQSFARLWVHSAMVNVGSQKMAKSLGNYTHLADAIDAVGPRAVRLLVAQTHYRKAMEMGADALEAAHGAVGRLDAFARRFDAAGVDIATDESADPTQLDMDSLAAFREAMDDDFSTPGALDVIFRAVRGAHSALDDDRHSEAARLARTAVHLLAVLGLRLGADAERDRAAGAGPGAGLSDDEIEAMLSERGAAREARDFATADRIRDELAQAGVVVADNPAGVSWHRA